jgi:hypothetical protein
MVQNPLKIQEKNLKKFFLGIYPGTKSPFFSAKNCFKFFLGAVSTRFYHRKKNKKIQVVPGTKYGVFRHFLSQTEKLQNFLI